MTNSPSTARPIWQLPLLLLAVASLSLVMGLLGGRIAYGGSGGGDGGDGLYGGPHQMFACWSPATIQSPAANPAPQAPVRGEIRLTTIDTNFGLEPPPFTCAAGEKTIKLFVEHRAAAHPLPLP